jgi:hypothetical protein
MLYISCLLTKVALAAVAGKFGKDRNVFKNWPEGSQTLRLCRLEHIFADNIHQFCNLGRLYALNLQ